MDKSFVSCSNREVQHTISLVTDLPQEEVGRTSRSVPAFFKMFRKLNGSKEEEI